MTNYDLEEDKLIKIQIKLSFIFIFSLITSILLSYNTMMDLEKRQKIFNKDDEVNILKINRTITFIVALFFLIINVYDKNIKKKYNLDNKNSSIQILSSLLTLISSILVLYIAFSGYNSFTSNENPEV